jgi:hypothetical protein
MSPQPPRSQDAKVEGRDDPVEQSSIERFRSLTRRLLSVRRDELSALEKQRREQDSRGVLKT